MKVNLEKVSNLERRLHIEVPIEKVSEAFNKVYRKIQGQVALKGFRKGKAPITTVKSLYGDHARRDVIDDLVQEYYVKALVEQSLDPVSHPQIKIETFAEDASLKFICEFEVRPDVSLSQIEGLTVEKERFEHNDKLVEEALETLTRERAQLVELAEPRGAKMGDTAVIDFEGLVDGKPLENAQGNEHSLELGSGNFIPGFEEGIVGMTPNESKTLNLKFPEEYHAAQLAGKPVEFKVTLKSIKTKNVPELNDEFAKTLGQESLEKLRETVKNEQVETLKKKIDDDFKNRLMKVLVEKNPVDVPKSMVKEQKDILIEDVKKRMLGQGLTNAEFEQYKEKWDEDFAKSAVFMIQSGFLTNAVATKLELYATEEDVEKRFSDFATKSGLDVAKVRSFYAKDDAKQRLQFKITEDKVVEYLTGKANIKEVAADKLK